MADESPSPFRPVQIPPGIARRAPGEEPEEDAAPASVKETPAKTTEANPSRPRRRKGGA